MYFYMTIRSNTIETEEVVMFKNIKTIVLPKKDEKVGEVVASMQRSQCRTTLKRKDC